MKKVALFLLLVVVLVLAPSALAQTPDGNYFADFQVVNLSATDAATISLDFYNQAGTLVASVPDTIAADSSTTYSPLPAAVPAGFNGSVVISSNQPVAAISNVKSNGGDYGSSYSSLAGGSNTVSLPLINRNFFGIDTWFNVQNTGSSATTVTVSYSDAPTCDQTATIQPNAATTFDQDGHTCLGDNYNGAATITTDEGGDEVAAVVMQVFGGGLLAYNGFAAGDTSPVIPLVTNNVFGIMTGIQLQNQGGTATNVEVTYVASDGTDCTESASIPAGGAETFSINVFGPGAGNTTSNCIEGEYWIGSASVTSNSASQPLVGIVNQTNFNIGGSSSYGAFSPSAATGTIVMPLLMDAFNIWTGWSVMNVGAADTVDCTYSGTAITVSFSLGTNEAQDVQNINGGTGDPGQTLPANYIGSGTCTAAGGGTLLGVVNQANMNVAPNTGDGVLTYESVNN